MLNMIIYLHHPVYSDKQGNISDLFYAEAVLNATWHIAPQ